MAPTTGNPLRNWITAGLALTVIGLTTAFLFVSIDEHGVVKRPAPPGGRGRVLPLRVPGAPDPSGGKGAVEDTAAGTPGATRDDPDGGGAWVEVEPAALWPATEAGVRSAADSRVSALRACWPSLLKQAGRTAGTEVTFTLSESDAGHGAITSARARTGSRGDSPLEVCMQAALADLRFASPPEPLQVEYTLLLEPEGG